MARINRELGVFLFGAWAWPERAYRLWMRMCSARDLATLPPLPTGDVDDC